MAARRLIIVLVVLFAVSIVAALIAPDRRGGLIGDRSTSSTETTTTTTTSTPETTRSTTTTGAVPSGEALTTSIDASATEPERVRASVGDQLALVVGSERAREIEIPAFGVTEDAAPEAPASFNLLLREPGTLEILDADDGKVLGLIEVAKAKSPK